ncbi:hypothetical protein CQW23_18024 [Capsicum baccatum]|uniref:DUF7722 domain-containing protein n=1 Tax=Capsicum baccatum TaxID=33114 RepID=A0A2G2WFQ9_CAPBA|nr:hypothetical protein CQW23_18024 [Capsicum baccatum]
MALNWLTSIAYTITLGNSSSSEFTTKNEGELGFRMPLHYPRYKKDDYENMEEWKIDELLREYGLSFHGSVDDKRRFAMGAFLWPDQL